MMLVTMAEEELEEAVTKAARKGVVYGIHETIQKAAEMGLIDEIDANGLFNKVVASLELEPDEVNGVLDYHKNNLA